MTLQVDGTTKEGHALSTQLARTVGHLYGGEQSEYDFLCAATGELDGIVTYKPFGRAWDYAGGIILVQEAGGIVRNLGSNRFTFGNFDFFAGSKLAYSMLVGSGALNPFATPGEPLELPTMERPELPRRPLNAQLGMALF